MLPLLPLLLGAVAVETGQDGRHPEAVQVFACDFEAQTDVNHDHWPDFWKRQRSPQYPMYLSIGIVGLESQQDNHCLEVGMNGGAALIHSPPIPISPLFSYVLEARVRTDGLEHTAAHLSASYYDAQHKLVDTVGISQRVGGTQPWTKLRVGPFSSSHDEAAYVIVSLHVEAVDDGFDLTGSARFDDVWLARLPRMRLHTNSSHNVFSDGNDIEITCDVSGIQERDPMLTFELVDLSSRTLAEMNDRLDGKIVALASNKIADLASKQSAQVQKTDNGYQGEMRWRPPIEENGFYRVRVRMVGMTGVIHQREISLVVVRPLPPPSGGEFGWSLPEGDRQIPLEEVADMLKQVGASWVKFPLWYPEADRERADGLARFIEQLNTNHIELVGMIDQPPAQLQRTFSERDDRLPAASIFADRDVWYPALNPVLTRLSLKVQWWQLGADDDISFMGHPQLPEKIKEVSEQITRFGQTIQLGLPWRWLNEIPQVREPPWDFLSLTSDPQMTADEIGAYLTADEHPAAQRWVMLEPLSAKDYPVEERARDLVLRMISAKMNHADVTFATNPFDPETGLMSAAGSPGELLLPWRTTAYMISGTEYLGSITLPGGSRNYILARGDEAIMVVWNENETEEVINLGDPREIEHIDLWGRVMQPQRREHRQVYKVGPLPTFITGVSREMAQWRMDFHFIDTKLQSLYGRPQFPRYRMKNPFRQGAGGTIHVRTPEDWGNPPPPMPVNMSGGEDRTDRVEIVLRSNASSGAEPVRVDFDISADRDYKFSVWRTLEVGLGDVVMEFNTHVDEDGNLVVEQKLINTTDAPVDFKCFLFPPGRRRLRQNVLHQTRGANVKTYVLPNGEELLGQTLWLRAEEIYGNRVLNYRFPAEAE